MHYLVCIKQVPDTTEVKLDPVTNALDRRSAPTILNPYDAHAVEEAVRMQEVTGGKVTVITMGPPMAEAVVRKAVELGAEGGVVVTDRAFAGADTLATSYALTQTIRKINEDDPVDLIFAGKQAIDGDTAQVGPGIAGRLNIPVLTQVDKIISLDEENRVITVRRRRDGGYEIIQSALPCLITVEREINDLTYSSLPNMIKAARYTPLIWTTENMEVDKNQLGFKGSPTVVSKTFAPPKQSVGEILEGSTAEVIAKVIDNLTNVHGLFAKEVE
jgi:electron transfer flavoprotein beta subunit